MPSLQTQILWMKRARMAMASLTVLAIGAFYCFVYAPSTRRLRELNAQTVARQAELRNNQAKSSVKTEIAARNEKLKQELERIRKPSKWTEFSQFLKDLTSFAQQSNLKKFDVKPGMPLSGDLYMEAPLAMTFEGDFLSVSSFVRSIEDMQRLTRVRTMDIRVRPDRNEAANGQVQASVSLNIYFSPE